MNTPADHLLSEALKLPAAIRENLAVKLMGSIEVDSSAEAEEIKESWTREIDLRMARLDSGESKEIPVEEAWPQITGKPWRQSDA